jgi:hypothetical protein
MTGEELSMEWLEEPGKPSCDEEVDMVPEERAGVEKDMAEDMEWEEGEAGECR